MTQGALGAQREQEWRLQKGGGALVDRVYILREIVNSVQVF